MSDAEISQAYEENTGQVIARAFKDIDPIEVPAVLVANHAPFTWGMSVSEAAQHAVILEAVAKLAHLAIQIYTEAPPAGRTLCEKHFLRKHGSSAYYGQPKNKE
jgi:L-ribulose-5-phosphate 4-epimerase